MPGAEGQHHLRGQRHLVTYLLWRYSITPRMQSPAASMECLWLCSA